jgi:uncharacterized small protein (DUF1192 family)
MDEEDLEPKKPKGLQARVLDTLSIDELEAYIGELKEEISRCEADIARKRDVRAGAEQFFKK